MGLGRDGKIDGREAMGWGDGTERGLEGDERCRVEKEQD